MELVTVTDKEIGKDVSIPAQHVLAIRELEDGRAVLITASWSWETLEMYDAVLGRYRMAAGII